jgi:hypothetical protein
MAFYSLIFRSLRDAQGPLGEWTPEEIGKEVMLESMELLTQAARSTPNFEADRLREENPRRFTFSDYPPNRWHTQKPPQRKPFPSR